MHFTFVYAFVTVTDCMLKMQWSRIQGLWICVGQWALGNTLKADCGCLSLPVNEVD